MTPGDYVFRFESVGSNPLARAENLDRPGLNCRLDGISLRRFPWEDLYGQMQRYLEEEEKLFADRVDRAKQVVTELDAAIRRFRKDTGHYPEYLGELIERPRRFRSSARDWPYVPKIGTDPWEQHYRYDHPGRFNPDAFDVYSVRGNSRNPSLWIGNWPNPFHIRGALEGEQLDVTARSNGVTFSKQKIGIASFPPLSDGNLLFVRLQQKGNSIEFTLPPTLTPGRYVLSVRLVTSWDYAVVRMYFNGAQIGQTIDTYTPVIDAESVLLGTVDVDSKVNTLTLEAVARNPKSTGCCAGIDAVMLTPAR